jgi:hypothetical protein
MDAMHLPLPLELTEPVLLAGDLESQLRTSLGSSTYDPKTQLCCGGDGGKTHSNQQCQSNSGNMIIDVTVDVQIDNNDF